MQGGWNMYRVHEITPQIIPFLILSLTILALSLLKLKKIFWNLTFTLFLLAGGYALLIEAFMVIKLPQFRFSSFGIILLVLCPLAWLISASIENKKI